MGTLVKFLDWVEAKILFPIGRRVWQGASVIAAAGVLCLLIILVINLIPPKQYSLVITRDEVIEKRMDTTILNAVREPLQLPDPRMQEGEKEKIMLAQWEYVVQRMARIPISENRFERYFREFGLAQEDYEGRFAQFQPFDSLMFHTDSAFLLLIYLDYLKILEENYISLDDFNRIISIYKLLRPDNFFIQGGEDWGFLKECIRTFKYSNPTEGERRQVSRMVEASRDIQDYSGNRWIPIELAKETFNTSLTDEELVQAVDMFLEDQISYKVLGMSKSYRNFLNLYREKKNYLESQYKAKQEARKARLSRFLKFIGYGFGALLALTFVLLFFSIERKLGRVNE